MKIERFEDIEGWKAARELAKMVYKITGSGDFRKDYGLRDQIQRAAVSIMANIAEGFDTDSDLEFIRFLTYSRRSSTEIQSHIYVALDRQYIAEEEFKKVYQKTIEVKNLIYGFIRYLRSKKRHRT